MRSGINIQIAGFFLLLISTLLAVGSLGGSEETMITWELDNLLEISRHPLTLIGRPTLVGSALKAIHFDGEDDGLRLNVLPISSWQQFTIEVIFRPDANGPREQRFVHLQEDQSDNRVLIETRMPSANLWFLDTFIKSGKTDETLYAEKFTHPAGRWYHAALMYDGQEMRHYVNGIKEMSSRVPFTPLSSGQTSLGVRLNQVHWFRGDIRRLRFSPRALGPHEFLKSE